jgi:hypothetical protein
MPDTGERIARTPALGGYEQVLDGRGITDPVAIKLAVCVMNARVTSGIGCATQFQDTAGYL